MNTLKVDVVVFGGGPAGTPLAMALSKAGQQVLLVEDGPGLGGTCLFHGCVPSKIFRESARVRAFVERAGEFGISGTDGIPTVDWNTVQGRKGAILSARAAGALQTANQIPLLKVLFGRARFSGPHNALVDGPDGQIEVQFDRAAIATGSVSNRLSVPGADTTGVLTSEEFIGIDYLPESLVVVGGGPIGVEMAQIFHMLGTSVTILEVLPDILQPIDRVLTRRLEETLLKSGIRVETGVRIHRIETTPVGPRVHFQKDGTDVSVGAQVVLSVVGRRPNVDNLGLETTKVAFDSHGIKVDEHLATAEPNIYAVGDVTGQPMFAHWATAQAQALASHLLGRKTEFPKREHNPAVIFSYPEIGTVGLTEEAARAAGLCVAVAEYNFATDARAQIAAEAQGLLRIVYRTDNGIVVGVHVLVEGAADLMGEAALAVRSGSRISDIMNTIHPHPTLTESFGVAARSAVSMQLAATMAGGGTK